MLALSGGLTLLLAFGSLGVTTPNVKNRTLAIPDGAFKAARES